MSLSRAVVSIASLSVLFATPLFAQNAAVQSNAATDGG
jgi:hypothetical protein